MAVCTCGVQPAGKPAYLLVAIGADRAEQDDVLLTPLTHNSSQGAMTKQASSVSAATWTAWWTEHCRSQVCECTAMVSHVSLSNHT